MEKITFDFSLSTAALFIILDAFFYYAELSVVIPSTSRSKYFMHYLATCAVEKYSRIHLLIDNENICFSHTEI
jgi:hypothetical protein